VKSLPFVRTSRLGAPAPGSPKKAKNQRGLGVFVVNTRLPVSARTRALRRTARLKPNTRLPSSPAPTGDADRKHSYPATANHAPPPPPGAGTGRCRAPTTRQNPAPPSTTNQPASLRTGCGSAWAAGCNADTHGHPAANVRIILDAIPQNCYSFRRSLLCKVKGKKHTMQMRLTGI